MIWGHVSFANCQALLWLAPYCVLGSYMMTIDKGASGGWMSDVWAARDEQHGLPICPTFTHPSITGTAGTQGVILPGYYTNLPFPFRSLTLKGLRVTKHFQLSCFSCMMCGVIWICGYVELAVYFIAQLQCTVRANPPNASCSCDARMDKDWMYELLIPHIRLSSTNQMTLFHTS